MNFLPIALLAYVLNAGSTIIDKILLTKSVPNPLVYIFYIGLLGFLTLVLLPFGVNFGTTSISFSFISGICFNIAVYCYFQALKKGEASVVVPVVGSLNPLFTLLIGTIFLSYALTQIQYVAFFVILFGTGVLTFNLWARKVKTNLQFLFMAVAGFSFAISYIFLKEVFTQSGFFTGLVLTRVGASLSVLPLVFIPAFRRQAFSSKLTHNNFINKVSFLFLAGQAIGAIHGVMLTVATYLANPALVNSLFGVQYMVILAVAIFFANHHKEKLLDENLTKGVLVQKLIGAGILSLGVYLLSL